MIKIVPPGTWTQDLSGDRFALTRRIEPGIDRISVVAEGWSRSMRHAVQLTWHAPDVPIESGESIAVPLVWIDTLAMASVSPPARKGGMLHFQAPAPALRIAWHSPAYALEAPSSVAVLPDCLRAATFTPEPTSGSTRLACCVDFLNAGDVEGALDEFGLICLEGSREDTLVAANLMLQSLARRPFQRTPLLGAFVGALCIE